MAGHLKVAEIFRVMHFLLNGLGFGGCHQMHSYIINDNNNLACTFSVFSQSAAINNPV
jgi:hypothetical protein